MNPIVFAGIAGAGLLGVLAYGRSRRGTVGPTNKAGNQLIDNVPSVWREIADGIYARPGVAVVRFSQPKKFAPGGDYERDAGILSAFGSDGQELPQHRTFVGDHERGVPIYGSTDPETNALLQARQIAERPVKIDPYAKLRPNVPPQLFGKEQKMLDAVPQVQVVRWDAFTPEEAAQVAASSGAHSSVTVRGVLLGYSVDGVVLARWYIRDNWLGGILGNLDRMENEIVQAPPARRDGRGFPT